MVQHGPFTAIAKLNGWEVDGVEVDVILAHELEKLDIFLIEPPLFPIFGVVGGNTRVSYRCIELNFVSASFQKSRSWQSRLTQTSVKLSQLLAILNDYRNIHRTFPFMDWSSSVFFTGTGTPQVRSRVRGLGRSPLFRRESISSPSALMTEFGDHLPALYDFLIHSSVCDWILSRAMYIWRDSFVTTLCSLLIRHLGLMSSTASNVRPQPSH